MTHVSAGYDSAADDDDDVDSKRSREKKTLANGEATLEVSASSPVVSSLRKPSGESSTSSLGASTTATATTGSGDKGAGSARRADKRR